MLFFIFFSKTWNKFGNIVYRYQKINKKKLEKNNWNKLYHSNLFNLIIITLFDIVDEQ